MSPGNKNYLCPSPKSKGKIVTISDICHRVIVTVSDAYCIKKSPRLSWPPYSLERNMSFSFIDAFVAHLQYMPIHDHGVFLRLKLPILTAQNLLSLVDLWLISHPVERVLLHVGTWKDDY